MDLQSRRIQLFLHAVSVLAHLIAAAGLLLILYGIAAQLTGKVWEPIEPFLRPTSVILTLAALILTCASIYPEWRIPRPTDLSQTITAPAMIIVALAGLAYEVVQGLPASAINGFALLGLAGAIFRMFPRANLSSDAP